MVSLDLCAPFFVWQISNLPHFISAKSGANTGARIKRSCEILERQDHYWCVWFMARASRHSQNTCMLLLVVLMDDVDALIVTAAGVNVIMSVVERWQRAWVSRMKEGNACSMYSIARHSESHTTFSLPLLPLPRFPNNPTTSTWSGHAQAFGALWHFIQAP